MSVQIRRWTGATPTKTDITSINTRLNATDGHSTAGTTHPIPVPSSGSNYSYWATTSLYFDGAGTGTIDSIEVYSDGTDSLGTGVTAVGNTADGYVQATGTEGTSGTELTTGNHANLADAPEDIFGWSTGSPKPVTGSVTDPENEDFGHQIVWQVAVADTASAGATTAETITWRYNSTISA